MTVINTACRWTSPLCRRVAPRQNLPAGDAGPKAEATGYTWLIVQSFSTPLDTSIWRGLPPSPPKPQPGQLELKPSDIQTRLPPGVFPGAPYCPPSTPHNISDLSAMRRGIPVLSTQAWYPIPRLPGVFRRLIATNARLSKRFISRVSGQKNVTRYTCRIGIFSHVFPSYCLYVTPSTPALPSVLRLRNAAYNA